VAIQTLTDADKIVQAYVGRIQISSGLGDLNRADFNH